MGTTTFNGPVRSENGFEQISKNSTTGAITTNLDIDSSGNITTTGYVSSYANVSSITSATKSVESTDSGTVYTLNRAAGIVVTLPTAAAGINYTFIVGTTFTGAGQINTDNASDLFSGLRDRLEFSSDIEITLEANPGTFEAEKFAEYRNLGINRLSIGVQSFNDRQLKFLGRIHSGEEARSAIIEAQNAMEAFFTSSTALIKPVTRIDEFIVGGGMPGKITCTLIDKYFDFLENAAETR